MQFARQLDDDEIRDLETMSRTAVGRVSQRAHMVLLSNRNYCIAEIARVFHASENTVRQWIERYERDGADSLDDRSRSGWPPKVSAAIQAAVHEHVLKPPSELGYTFFHTKVLSSRVAGDHVIYEDESDLHLLPTLRSAWMPRGKQLRVPTPGTNQKKTVFGAMDIRTGAFMHLIFDRKRAA